MIQSFRHRGLKRLFLDDDATGVRTDQLKRISGVLANLDTAVRVTDVDLPGYRLHALKGELRGYWSIAISANWRITFRFLDGDCFDVDLVDYH